MWCFLNFCEHTNPLGILFKWKLTGWSGVGTETHELPGDIYAIGPCTTLWIARDSISLGLRKELSGEIMKAPNERRSTQTRWKECWMVWEAAKPECKYRYTMSKGKGFRWGEVPAHEAPVHYSHWLWVTPSLLELLMANILESAAIQECAHSH